MRYNMLGAPQAKILWSAPSKSRFYYLFWLLELMPGHLRRSILRILVLNPTHEISWSRSGFFSLRGRILRAGPPGPPLFSCFCFLPPSLSLGSAGPPTLREFKNAPPRSGTTSPTGRTMDKIRRASGHIHKAPAGGDGRVGTRRELLEKGARRHLRASVLRVGLLFSTRNDVGGGFSEDV